MSTTDLDSTRKELVDWINSLEDDAVLRLLNSVKQSNETYDWWQELSEADKDNINSGLKDFEEGRTLSSKQFWQHLKNG